MSETCWVCEYPIPEGEFSRDHLLPRYVRKRNGGEWRPADIECNNARSDLPVAVVETIKRNRPGWTQAELRAALVENRSGRPMRTPNTRTCVARQRWRELNGEGV